MNTGSVAKRGAHPEKGMGLFVPILYAQSRKNKNGTTYRNPEY